MDCVRIWKRIFSFMHGRGYKTTDVVQEVQKEPMKKQEEPIQKVRHPKRKARLLLSKYGIDGIYTQDDVNRIFWEMAIRRKPMTKNIINAVHIMICDNSQMKSFNRKLELYQKFMDGKASDTSFTENEDNLKAEVIKLKQDVVLEQKAKNKLRQKLEQEEGQGRKLAKKFINQLKTPNSRYQQIYDFTKEEDIEEFLSWFKILKRQVAKRTIKGIVKNWHSGDEGQELFLRMVKAHNAQFQPDPDDSEEYLLNFMDICIFSIVCMM